MEGSVGVGVSSIVYPWQIKMASRAWLLLALNMSGFILSAILVIQHYEGGEGGGSRICELGQQVSCSR